MQKHWKPSPTGSGSSRKKLKDIEPKLHFAYAKSRPFEKLDMPAWAIGALCFMGMFDHVTCELPMPDGREVIKDSFQTKSLGCCMEMFTITAAGRLIFHKRKYYCAGEKDARGKPRMPEPVADIDLEYHGDIELYGLTPDNTGVRYAVRFTHGSVEWIFPFEQLTKRHQWALGQRDY